jgi:hypothetical protein
MQYSFTVNFCTVITQFDISAGGIKFACLFLCLSLSSSLGAMAPYKFTESDVAKGHHLILFYVYALKLYKWNETGDILHYIRVRRNELLQPFQTYDEVKILEDDQGNQRYIISVRMVGQMTHLWEQKREQRYDI